jgi:hypothetical protein
MKTRIFTAILILLTLTACNSTIEIGLEHSPTIAVEPAATIPTSIQVATNTPIAPTVNVPQPSPTIQAATGTSIPTDLPLASLVQIYLIGLEDNGQTGVTVGCGDSAIPVQVEIQPTQGVLKAALEALLSIKDQYYGQSGLYNALYQSDLQVDSININNGKATVYLSGSLIMGGECDNPRVQAQLEQTVLQFPTVTEADIYVNGKPLSDVLSLKG